MAKMHEITVTASYNKSEPVEKAFQFPVFDPELKGLGEVYGGAVGIFKAVYHAKVVELQAGIRAEIKASMNEGGKKVSRKRDPNLVALIG